MTKKPINLRHIPERLEPVEAELLRGLHTVYCGRRGEVHECSGRLFLDRNGVTMSCPLCGDARKVFPPANPSHKKEEAA